MSERETLSEMVQRIMRQKGLTIREVELRAGERIANSYISRIVSGQVKNLSVDKLVVLAQGLGVDPYELFAAASGKAPQRAGQSGASPGSLLLVDVLQKLVLNPSLLEVVQELDRLMPEQLSAILQAARAFNRHQQERPPMRRKA